MALSIPCVPLRADESSGARPEWIYSSYSVDALGGLQTSDRSLFDTVALGRIASRLGARRHTFLFNPKRILSPTYDFYGGLDKYSLFSLRLDSLPEGAPRAAYYRIGVEAFAGKDYWSTSITQAFLRSAYLEEVLPEYRALTSEAFVTLDPKSGREFWTRNLFSMGYAIEYLAKGNPFSPEVRSSAMWGYFWDVVVYGLLASSLFSGEGEGALGALAFGAGMRVLWVGSKQAHLDYYNRIVESGYGVPRMAQYDSLRTRSLHGKDEVVWKGRMKRFTAAAPNSAMDIGPLDTEPSPPGASGGRAYAVAPEKSLVSASREPNPFAGEEVPAKVSGATKLLVIGISPLVGILGGMAYGELMHSGDDQAAAASALKGMLLGLFVGVTFAISL